MTDTKPPSAGARTQFIPIQLIEVGNKRYGLIVGKERVIVTNSEFIHWIDKREDAISLQTDWQTDKYEDFSLDDLLAVAKPMDLRAFGHYWGIKQRMAGNYALLRKSMREIGVSDKAMPKFGD